MTKRVPPEPCPLCGHRGKKTKEHVFPRWQQALFPGGWEIDHFTHGRRTLGPYVKIFVCVSCQRWLNTRFEIPSKLLLEAVMRGQRLTLTVPLQQQVAAYVTKQVLLIAIWQNRYAAIPSTFRPHDFHWFRAHASALPDSQVWLAFADADPEREEEVAFSVPPLMPAVPEILPAGSSSYVYMLLNMFCLFVRIKNVESRQRLPGSVLGRLERADSEGSVARIWPARDSDIDWPLPLLNRRDIGRAAFMLGPEGRSTGSWFLGGGA